MVIASSGVNAACPPGYPLGLPCPQEPYETVGLEHQDRLNRLGRLSSGNAKPQFSSDYLDPAEHGLLDYPVPIPVLRVVFDQSVFFDVDSSSIRTEAYPILDVIAEDLRREPPDVSLFIAGHTDWSGDDNYNFNLGLRRAEAVAQALVRRGIYQASVYRVSFGEAVPIADNSTEKGRARNRRVEFLFGAKAQAVTKWLEKQPIQSCAALSEAEMTNCRRALTFEAQQVKVDPSAEKEVVELANLQNEIEASTNLSPLEKKFEKQKIELKREKIPILLSNKKVPIQLGAK